MIELPENPDIPPKYAREFSSKISESGYQLDFSMRSLVEDIERLFDSEMVDKVSPEFTSNMDFQTGMSCYLGEVLKIHYQGEWKGHCTPNSAANFYTSHMLFGSYKFCPFIYITYRISNGVEDTGNVENFLRKLVPSLKSGSDLKKEFAKEVNKQGRIFHDNEPWI